MDSMFKRRGNILLSLFVFLSIFFMMQFSAKAQEMLDGERIAGSDRYETSISISAAGWNAGDSEVAVLATGLDFPDALSAAPLAKMHKAPILLTEPNTLDEMVSEELDRLGTKKVYIVGGPGAISLEVENQLKEKGMECIRLYGKDRYETSAAVANEMGKTDRVVIATGVNFPDALSIAPWAAANGIPILLTEPNNLPQSIANYMNSNNIVNSYVIGGTGVVGERVVSRLKKPIRISGQDRFSTNVAVLSTFGSEFDFGKLYLATGNDFPDALSGSALAAMTKSPIVLTDKKPLPATKNIVYGNWGRMREVHILGGEGVVSNAAAGNVIPPTYMKLAFSVSSKAVRLNGSIKVSAKPLIIPDNGIEPIVSYSVDDPSVVRVEEDGTVTGLMQGETKIRATAGGKTATMRIVVRTDKMLVVIDPGHGGSSSGATPKLGNRDQSYAYREAVLNLQIAQKVKSKLNNPDIEIMLTREGDTYISLEGRAKLANEMGADLFISIHHDASTSTSARGTSAYYSSYKPGVDSNLDIIAKQSQEIAKSINSGIASLGLKNRGIFHNSFAVNRLTNMASALIEVGFITNIGEFNMIAQDSFQEKVAEVIAKSIEEYYQKNW